MEAEDYVKLLKVLGAGLAFVVSFFFGVYQWRAQRRAEADTRRLEATKVFLERQLRLYTEASQVAAVLATSTDLEATNVARRRFWELFWGELALVEDSAVEKAMEGFGAELKKEESDQEVLQDLSLKLAHKCRSSLDRAWGVKAWAFDSSPSTATPAGEH